MPPIWTVLLKCVRQAGALERKTAIVNRPHEPAPQEDESFEAGKSSYATPRHCSEREGNAPGLPVIPDSQIQPTAYPFAHAYGVRALPGDGWQKH